MAWQFELFFELVTNQLLTGGALPARLNCWSKIQRWGIVAQQPANVVKMRGTEDLLATFLIRCSMAVSVRSLETPLLLLFVLLFWRAFDLLPAS